MIVIPGSGGSFAVPSTTGVFIPQKTYYYTAMSPIDHILACQRRHRLASHIFFWLIVYLLGISSSKYYDGKQFSIGFSLISDGLYMSTEVIAAYFLAYLIIPAFFYRKKYIAASAAFLLGSYLICLLARFIVVRIAEPLAGVKPKPFEDNHELLTDIPKLIYVYFFQIFAVALVFLIIRLLTEHISHQQRTLTLEKEKIATELRLLKSQLNPHFLFNTLNNIYALSILNSPVTSTCIGKLSEMLDYILYHCDSTLVPLSGEINLLNNYLGLERLRYDQRLQLRFTSHIEKETPIPPLLLLSLAENAFKHGASQDPGQPSIDIDLRVTPDSLRYAVSNTIVDQPNPNTTGNIGLPNIRQQLDLLYPNRHTLLTNNENNRFTALLTLNLKSTP
ncbi:MAG: histidine kinase [Bacteroidetes bacterium]|nr:histidine kinase [Bacteroidota bacterium]